MTTYTTKTPDNEKDLSTFTNPFTNQVYHRGKLQVHANLAEITGSEAKSIVAKQQKYIAETTHPDFTAVIDPTHIAIGPFISALGDNLFFDAVLGVGTNGVFGYNQPNVFKKLQKLGSILPGFMGAGTDFYYTSRHGAPAAQDLAELMCAHAKAAYNDDYVMNFANAGTESNENGLKVAMFSKFREIHKKLGEEKYATMCSQLGIKKVALESDELWSNYPFFIIAFKNAFHGRTATSNTISMSKRKQKEGYQALPYVVHARYNSETGLDGLVDDTPLEELIKSETLKKVIDSGKIPADLLAAIIVEPVQGEGGYVIPEKPFLTKLNEFVDKYRKHGMFLVSDEVQTGLFRTGEFTGMQNWFKDYSALKPDIMTFAKPLHVGGVLINRKRLGEWPGGKFSGTWSEGNLLGIAVACYTLEELKQTDPSLGRSYQDNAKEAGKYLRSEIEGLAERLEKKHPGTNIISNVRGLGQMNAFDVPNGDLVGKIVHESFHHGLHILGTGSKSIRVFGTVDQRQREADMLVSILESVFEKIMAEEGASAKSVVGSSKA